jgi:hypothetical protein
MSKNFGSATHLPAIHLKTNVKEVSFVPAAVAGVEAGESGILQQRHLKGPQPVRLSERDTVRQTPGSARLQQKQPSKTVIRIKLGGGLGRTAAVGLLPLSGCPRDPPEKGLNHRLRKNSSGNLA